MTMRVSDPIRSAPRGKAAEAIAFYEGRGAKRMAFLREHITELYVLGKKYTVDSAILVAQSDLETGGFTSAYWEDHGNPAGLAAFPDGTYAGGDYPSGTIAARAQFAHMLAYLGIEAPESLAALDPRYNAVKEAGYWGKVTVIDDLGDGLWATDADYAGKIVGRGNKTYPDLPDSGGGSAPDEEPPANRITFGLVPHPDYLDRPVKKAEGKGQNNLGKRTVKGVSWHRILGTLWGTDGFFRNPDVGALTDYGVGVLAQDGAANDGVIMRWNDPLGYQSGWASGTYSAAHAYGDGAAFVAKYGVDAINRDRASIEISGFQTTPLSTASRLAIAGITAYWADQYKIPWQDFPNSPKDGFSFVTWHEEFGPDLGQKKCPFQVVKAETPTLIEMTRAILKHYQTGGTVDPDPQPEPEPEEKHQLPDWMTPQMAKRLFGRYVHPDGEVYEFDLGEAPSQVWLARGKRTDHWPEIEKVIRRGDGSELWQWTDGSYYPRKAKKEA